MEPSRGELMAKIRVLEARLAELEGNKRVTPGAREDAALTSR